MTEIADKRAFVSVIKLMNGRVYRRARVIFAVRRSPLRCRFVCERHHFGSKPIRLAIVQYRTESEQFLLRPRREGVTRPTPRRYDKVQEV